MLRNCGFVEILFQVFSAFRGQIVLNPHLENMGY